MNDRHLFTSLRLGETDAECLSLAYERALQAFAEKRHVDDGLDKKLAQLVVREFLFRHRNGLPICTESLALASVERLVTVLAP